MTNASGMYAICLYFGAIAVALPTHAAASHGGPELAEVLGWDSRDQKAFVLLHHQDESGFVPTLIYFALDAPQPRAVVVPWSHEAEWRDSTYQSRLRGLKRRLRPLPTIPAASIPRMVRALEADTIDAYGQRWVRYRVQIEVPFQVQVLTFRDPAVRLLSLHPIPGRRERLAILSFVGIPFEEGYEAQVPVVLPREAATTPVMWERR